MTILAIDPGQRTNAERVADLAALGYLPEPVLDPTYGRKGGMWKRYRPKALIASDLDPRCGLPTFDFRQLPWADGTFGSVLFDPPYRLAGTATNQGGMDDRYGIDRYRGVAETLDLILDGAAEAARVTRPGGFVIVKCQAQVCGGKVRWQPYEVVRAMEAERVDLDLVDELLLLSHRAQPPRKCKTCRGVGFLLRGVTVAVHCTDCDGRGTVPMVQQHAARNYSTFLVFRRAA